MNSITSAVNIGSKDGITLEGIFERQKAISTESDFLIRKGSLKMSMNMYLEYL